MNRAAIYARLALADEKSTSIERQAKDCRDHAKSLGLEVVAGHPARLHTTEFLLRQGALITQPFGTSTPRSGRPARTPLLMTGFDPQPRPNP